MKYDVKAIIEAMRNSGLEVFGVRRTYTQNRVNTYLARSHDWDFVHDRPSAHLLHGSSAIGICRRADLEDDDLEERVEKAIEAVTSYPGTHLYVVGGERYEYGDDDGEWIINNDGLYRRHGAKVVSMIE